MGTNAENAGGALRPALDSQLRRYNRSYRRRLRKAARSSGRFMDLIYSFPAAAFVVASNQGNPVKRAQAMELVEEGAALRQIADELGLPYWTRRLPPEAFTQSFGQLPKSEAFAKKVVNLIPKEADHCGKWFSWVVKAHNLCDEDFALWLARQRFWAAVNDDASVLLPLAAFVWFGNTPGTAARGYIEKPWKRGHSFSKAVEAAHGWFTKLLLEDCRDKNGQTGRWFVPQKVSGYRIFPLRQVAELQEEGRIMDNCVADYASAVATGQCLIYSVRRGNDHVATLEVKPGHKMDGTPFVAQLLGPYNDEADEGVHRAVDSWLKRQGHYPFVATGQFALAGFNARRWKKLWAPYMEAKGLSSAQASGEGGDLRQFGQPIQMHRALGSLSKYA